MLLTAEALMLGGNLSAHFGVCHKSGGLSLLRLHSPKVVSLLPQMLNLTSLFSVQ
jgi:hypothetical protein